MLIALIAAAAIATPGASPCSARHVSLTTDAREGDFDGMSQSGTYLVVRNNGAKPCTMPGLPVVVFYGDTARSVGAVRRAPVGMHPGPVVMPVTVPAGGTVATALRWVAGPVFDRNRSARVEAVGVTIGGRVLRTMLQATIFGQIGRPITFSQTPLAPFPPAG